MGENKGQKGEILNENAELRNKYFFFLLSKPGIRRRSKTVHWQKGILSG